MFDPLKLMLQLDRQDPRQDSPELRQLRGSDPAKWDEILVRRLKVVEFVLSVLTEDEQHIRAKCNGIIQAIEVERIFPKN